VVPVGVLVDEVHLLLGPGAQSAEGDCARDGRAETQLVFQVPPHPREEPALGVGKEPEPIVEPRLGDWVAFGEQCHAPGVEGPAFEGLAAEETLAAARVEADGAQLDGLARLAKREGKAGVGLLPGGREGEPVGLPLCADAHRLGKPEVPPGSAVLAHGHRDCPLALGAGAEPHRVEAVLPDRDPRLLELKVPRDQRGLLDLDPQGALAIGAFRGE